LASLRKLLSLHENSNLFLREHRFVLNPLIRVYAFTCLIEELLFHSSGCECPSSNILECRIFGDFLSFGFFQRYRQTAFVGEILAEGARYFWHCVQIWHAGEVVWMHHRHWHFHRGFWRIKHGLVIDSLC
jgi:hypothetical protein